MRDQWGNEIEISSDGIKSEESKEEFALKEKDEVVFSREELREFIRLITRETVSQLDASLKDLSQGLLGLAATVEKRLSAHEAERETFKAEKELHHQRLAELLTRIEGISVQLGRRSPIPKPANGGSY